MQDIALVAAFPIIVFISNPEASCFLSVPLCVCCVCVSDNIHSIIDMSHTVTV